MSAFLCSDDTLKLVAIASVADLRGYCADLEPAQKALDLLHAANVAALVDLYGRRHESADGGAPVLSARDLSRLRIGVGLAFPPVVVLKQIACVNYQCCDWKDWRGSRAWACVEHARASMICLLPGYEAAPWGLP